MTIKKKLPGLLFFFSAFFVTQLSVASLNNSFNNATLQKKNPSTNFHIGDELPDLKPLTKAQQFKEAVGMDEKNVLDCFRKNNFNKPTAFKEYWNNRNKDNSVTGKYAELQSARDYNRRYGKKGRYLEPTSWYGGKNKQDPIDLVESIRDPNTGKKIIKKVYQYKFYTKGDILKRFKRALKESKYCNTPFGISRRLYKEIKKSSNPILGERFRNGMFNKLSHSDRYIDRLAYRESRKEFYKICDDYLRERGKTASNLRGLSNHTKIAGKAPKTIASTSKGFKAVRTGTNMMGKAVEAFAVIDIGISAFSFLNDLSIADQQSELDTDLFIERSALRASAHIGFDVTALYVIPATPDIFTGLAITGGLIITEAIAVSVIDYIFGLIQAHREWLRQIEEERVRNVSRLIQRHTVYKQHECIAIILRQMALEL